MKILLFFLYFNFTKAYDLCVIGATSGLGKELVYQSAVDKNISVLALSGKSGPLYLPCRSNSFQEHKNNIPFQNPNVHKGNYWKDVYSYQYKNVIFTTGASPFQQDYSDILMCKIIQELPATCEHVVLVSAHGVGSSLNPTDIGINIMDKWYLKEVYRAKNEQEQMLELDLFKKKYPNLKTSIFRPRALSYGKTILPSISRQQIAKNILDCIFPYYKK